MPVPQADSAAARRAAERAADLVNLLAEDPEPGQVAELLHAHGEVPPVSLEPADVAELREAAARLAPVFAAADVDMAANLLNDLLATHAHPPRLTTHGGSWPWHLHVDRDDDGPWGEWLLASSSLALATLVADRQLPPGGVCAARGCERVFAAAGSGSPRRFCSTRCATRARVAAHRTRGA
ncbi:CGNR zinc finger domain-containing protein [Amycolatopsis suaedae]|uniref:CGNR zinc finger domain-containing protein n=1 Tax=Amycolatopsis suaedae TaxID=2510978 RepID=A0A4Q7IZR4_9PSEU|nr:CGNR zinc finger domain-containing protein [Amycolatopsis suaedae]RZQ59987.1 CGNR zinc finger domain-containing protein [Amycolatopsis suaedae]